MWRRWPLPPHKNPYKSEAQSAARKHHPGIEFLLGACSSPPPFAMQKGKGEARPRASPGAYPLYGQTQGAEGQSSYLLLA